MTVTHNACCPEPVPTGIDDSAAEQASLRKQFVLSALCLVGLLCGWFGVRFSGLPPHLPHAFYLLAYVTGGYFPMLGVIEDLKSFRFNVNFLMVFAALGAAFVGAEAEGAVLMFLFSLSGALENFASGRTRKAIRSLMKLSPSEATVLREGHEQVLPVAQLVVGDVLVVHPGERIAGDGVIVEGLTSVDESSLTGEAIPVDRAMGARVMAGSINLLGMIKVKMDRAVSDTTLAKIFKIVEEAQQVKAPTQRLIETYGGPYTWIILFSTLVTFLGGLFWRQNPWTESLYRAMTLMVVASPCALVLSIPSAVLAAIAAGAWRGILFKGGRAVEIIGQARVIAFDKTGTLTLGKPRLAEGRYAQGVSEEEVLALVASVEQNSEHPLAQVLVNEAKKRGVVFARAAESRSVPGMGMEGTVDGRRIRVGNEAFICINGGMEPWAREVLVDFRSRGLTCLVAAAEKPLAVFGVSDSLRPGAPHAIHELNRLGVQTVMLTGDHEASAAEIARELGLTDFRASLLPHQKVNAIKDLIREHRTVAMVGDGVNDAPALVSASVGIAMGASGSDVAMENADVVLISDDIERVPEIVRLGRRAQAIIRQNLVFALAVIVVLIASTFLIKLPLAIGVIGHEGSTVLVVFNSLRLLRLGYRPSASPKR